MKFSPERPFDVPALPPLLGEGLPAASLETRAVLKACVAARVALAGLDEAVGKLPNPGVLLSSLVLLEAKASSQIENIVTTTDLLFQYANGEAGKTDSATKETLRYRAALYEGVELLKHYPLSTRVAERVCSVTKGIEMTVRKVPGITLRNERTGQTIYTPPEGESVLREKLRQWEQFCHAEDNAVDLAGDLDPLVRMAMLHYQFEAIHPFTDGNGRTGRILNLLFLLERGLLRSPVLFLSRYILKHRSAYYAGLLAVSSEQAWENWLLYVLDAVRDSALWTHQKINAMQAQMQSVSESIKASAPGLHSHELVQTIFAKPYCRIGDVASALSVRRQSASRNLKALCKLGILREVTFGREKLFVHPNLMSLLASESHES